MAHVAKYKKANVADIVQSIKGKGIVGIVNVDSIPGPQLSQMRRMLSESSNFSVAKMTLIKIALEQADEGRGELTQLGDIMQGQVGIVATDMNPFKLFQKMERTKTSAPAKGGEIAPDDIWVRAGETSFKPGPIVGELQKAGMPAVIEKGKVIIKKDKKLVEVGKKIPREVALGLTQLEIYPLTVGMNLRGATETGILYQRDVLNVDIDEFIGNIGLAGSQAFNLSMQIAYTTPITIIPLLGKAASEALSLTMEAAIPTSKSIALLLSKAQGQMMALATIAPDALDDELKEKLSAAPTPAPAAQAGDKKPDDDAGEEEEEKVSEDEAAAGLGALFG